MNADNPLAAAPLLASGNTASYAAASDAAPAAEAPWQRFQSTEEFEAWLVQAAVAQWGHLFGQASVPIWIYCNAGTTSNLAISRLATDAFSSATNLQVAGVDEADFVETDGEYIYIVSGSELVIVEAGVGENLRVTSRVHLEVRPVGMYLSGNRLALVSTTDPIQLFFGAWTPKTTVTVLNITDRAAPTIVQKTELDGQLVTSRTVDGQLRLVLSNQFHFPVPIARPVETEFNPDPQSDQGAIPSGQVYETQEEYLARVRDQIINLLRPRIRGLASDGSVISDTALFEAANLYRPDSLLDRSLTTIVTFDLMSNDTEPVGKASVLSDTLAQVYSTAENIYLFTSQSSDSRIWKFAIDGETHAVDLVAKGECQGTLLNQFAADEHDGYLRIVTESNGWSSTGQSVYVLQQVGFELQVIGSITGIAPREELYSVRFAGNRAFLVTFRTVDPLFAVDLSNPTNPRILGELHIPGYSDYLQPIDENHLITIGRGADEATGLFQELQVSLFNVSDLNHPRLVHRYAFGGGRSTVTPASGNRWQRGDGDHHSIAYFASEHIFSIPIHNPKFMGDTFNNTDSEPLFEPGQGGLQVFKIDLDTGFTPIALIEHDTLAERSVRIDDRLFVISSGTVSVHELANPTVQLGEISIDVETGQQPIEVATEQPIDEPVQRLTIRLVQPPSEQPADPPVETSLVPLLPPQIEQPDDQPIGNAVEVMEYLPLVETLPYGTEEAGGDVSTPEVSEEPVSEASTHISSARDTEFVRQIDVRLIDIEMGEVSDSKATGHNNREISEVISRGSDRASSTEQFSVIRQPGVDAYMNQIGRTVRRHSKWWSGVDTSDDNLKDLVILAIEARRQR